MEGEQFKKLLCYVYNSGYKSGHHDTVEGSYTDVMFVDFIDYHEDMVQSILEEFVYTNKE